MVEVSFSAVSKHADVPLSGLTGTRLDVSPKLSHCVISDVPSPKVTLHLEYGEPRLDVDSTALACRGFEDDLLQVTILKLQRRRSQQHVQIALDVRLGPTRLSDGQPLDQ